MRRSIVNGCNIEFFFYCLLEFGSPPAVHTHSHTLVTSVLSSIMSAIYGLQSILRYPSPTTILYFIDSGFMTCRLDRLIGFMEDSFGFQKIRLHFNGDVRLKCHKISNETRHVERERQTDYYILRVQFTKRVRRETLQTNKCQRHLLRAKLSQLLWTTSSLYHFANKVFMSWKFLWLN